MGARGGRKKAFDEAIREAGIVLGRSASMKRVRDLLARAAPSGSTVLIHGESGVGKELAARALHFGSPRAGKPFVAVNCGALTETLLESELFGHARGSFTGAVADKPGLVEVAHTGTLFLDEVSEMSPGLQMKVLRLIEQKEYKPVGSIQIRHADVRFITATHRDLEQEVRRGTFRQDLFFRLNVISARIPPLRERREDILPLAEHFLGKYDVGKQKRFGPDVREALLGHRWAGNVRELENAVQRAVALCEKAVIGPGDLFDADAAPQGGAHAPDGDLDLERAVAEVEIAHLRRAMEKSGGNETEAARLLKISTRLFRQKFRKHGLA